MVEKLQPTQGEMTKTQWVVLGIIITIVVAWFTAVFVFPWEKINGAELDHSKFAKRFHVQEIDTAKMIAATEAEVQKVLNHKFKNTANDATSPVPPTTTGSTLTSIVLRKTWTEDMTTGYSAMVMGKGAFSADTVIVPIISYSDGTQHVLRAYKMNEDIGPDSQFAWGVTDLSAGGGFDVEASGVEIRAFDPRTGAFYDSYGQVPSNNDSAYPAIESVLNPNFYGGPYLGIYGLIDPYAPTTVWLDMQPVNQSALTVRQDGISIRLQYSFYPGVHLVTLEQNGRTYTSTFRFLNHKG